MISSEESLGNSKSLSKIKNEDSFEFDNLYTQNQPNSINDNSGQIDTKKIESGFSKMRFSLLSRFFERASDLKGKKKTEFTVKFLNEIILKKDRQNSYEILCLILPHLDRERGSYGLKEANLAKIISDALGLPSNESTRLKYFKNPTHHPRGAPVGDFGNVLFSVVENLLKRQSQITIEEINEYLDKLSLAENNKIQVELTSQIMTHVTAVDLKWICRIILKDLKIGIKHEKILLIYHPDALDMYNATSNLREVCKEFENKDLQVGVTMFRLFYPIRPMLAAKKSADEIRQLFMDTEFLIETKFDGERIQCHFNQDELKFFSRNAIDYTYLYGKKLTDVIRDNCSAVSAILDGEIIVVKKDTGEVVPFGMNKTVALEDDPDSEFQLCYQVFDVLYVKGPKGEEANLMNVQLSDRKKILKRIIQNKSKMFEFVEGIQTKDINEIFRQFDQAVLRNEEGIIIKKFDSSYKPNDRATDWIKLKGDYLEGLTDTFDLIILGGYYGGGAVRIGVGDWSDHLTHFLLGLVKRIDEQTPEKSEFIPFCKVGTGYTVDELQELRNKLRGNWKKYDTRNLPYFITSWNPSPSEKPDVLIDNPKNSFLLETKAAELIKSRSFPIDYTLRFPRVIKIRYDKDWFECMRIQELTEMVSTENYHKNLKKRNPHFIQNNSEQGLINKKFLKPMSKQNVVMDKFKDTDTRHVNVEYTLFEGYEFFIVNTNDDVLEKKFLEEQIVKYGGLKVQNYRLTSTHIIAQYLDYRVKSILEKHPVPIIQPKWIVDCIANKRVLQLSPRYVIYTTSYLQDKFSKEFDQYGDSYEEEINPEILKQILDEMKYDTLEFSLDNDLHTLRQDLAKQLLPDYYRNFFNDKIFYVYNPGDKDLDLKFIEAQIISRRGKVVKKLIGDIDYILFENPSPQQKAHLDQYLKTHTITMEVSRQYLSQRM